MLEIGDLVYYKIANTVCNKKYIGIIIPVTIQEIYKAGINDSNVYKVKWLNYNNFFASYYSEKELIKIIC